MTPRDIAEHAICLAVVVGVTVAADLPLVPGVLAYLIVDRVEARRRTGSWFGFPSDLDDES